MITTPSMGLKRWDQPNDIFSYTELSDNWAAIDAHDHTTGKGVQVPSGGIANLAVTEPKIANDAVTTNKIAADAVTDTKILNNAVTTAKILNSNVTDVKLANNAVTTSKILDGAVTPAKLSVDLYSLSKVKTADEVKNNTATLATDTHLVFTGIQTGYYALDGHLIYDSSTVADFKFNLSATGVGGGFFNVHHADGVAGASQTYTASIVNFVNLNGYNVGIVVGAAIRGSIQFTSTGTLSCRWSQQTAEATNTTLQKFSWLRLTKVG